MTDEILVDLQDFGRICLDFPQKIRDQSPSGVLFHGLLALHPHLHLGVVGGDSHLLAIHLKFDNVACYFAGRIIFCFHFLNAGL